MKLVPQCNAEYPSNEVIQSEGNWVLVESVNKNSYKTKNDQADLIIWNSEGKKLSNCRTQLATGFSIP